MKRIIAIALLLLAYQQSDNINNFIDPVNYEDWNGGEVILYSTSWCGYCAKIRRLLNKKGIPYHEYDIERSAEAKAQYENLGGGGVPLLLINGVLIQGYQPQKILELAKQKLTNKVAAP